MSGHRSAPDAALASPELHADIGRFLAVESELADSRRFTEWVNVVDPEFTYQVPVPVTPDNPHSMHYDQDCLLIDESRESMVQLWFSRYEEGMYELAWGENPPVRYRHFVSNVRVRLTGDRDTYDVRSNVMLMGVRQSEPPAILTAERFDTVRGRDGDYRLLRRFAVLDQTVLSFPQIRVLL